MFVCNLFNTHTRIITKNTLKIGIICTQNKQKTIPILSKVTLSLNIRLAGARRAIIR